MDRDINGVIEHPDNERKTDYLYRISIKGIVQNEAGEILLVKESGRDWWDLPGGGMDHGESIKKAIAREMEEEVSLTGDFTYQIVHVDEPKLLEHSMIIQVRLVFIIKPEHMDFQPGEDSDEIVFMSLDKVKDEEPILYDYLLMILNKKQPF